MNDKTYPETKVWFLYAEHHQHGPYAESEIQSWLEKGLLSHDAWAWREGMSKWTVVRECAEFSRSPSPTPPVEAEEIRTRGDSAVIRFDEVEVSYGKNKALSGLSLDVHEGEIFGFIGNNGAGKTTAIHALLGMIPLRKGTISVFNRNPLRDYVEILDEIGFFPERLEPYEWMNLKELFKVGAASYRLWDTDLCRQLVGRFGLDTSKRVSELSKGMVAKTKLIFALSHKPRCLILDEPTEGLDPGSRVELIGILRQLTGEFRITTIYSSHNLHDVEGVATRVGILHRGGLIFDRTTKEITERMILATWKGQEPVPSAEMSACIVARQFTPEGACWLIRDRIAEPVITLLRGRPSGDHELASPTLEQIFMVLTSESAQIASSAGI